ncbi:hypothetical protein ACFQVA_16835 [Actinomadura keratinilytica]
MTDSTRPTAPGPHPEPIRFFGTTWLDHSGHYGLRRAGVAALPRTGRRQRRAAADRLPGHGPGRGRLGAQRPGRRHVRALHRHRLRPGVGELHQAPRPRAPAVAARPHGHRLPRRPRRLGPAQPPRGAGRGLRRAEYEEAVTQASRRRARRTGHPGRRAKR